MMNFTVSSLGDPHRDSCPKPGEANPPTNKTTSGHAGMIDTSFIALEFFRLYFTDITGQAFSSLRTKAAWTQMKTNLDGYRGSILQDTRTWIPVRLPGSRDPISVFPFSVNEVTLASH
jgi:hypothetical protein